MNVSDISEAYYGVYRSSQQIVKNQQRHLYCNMLDLLASTCKSSVSLTNNPKFTYDDQVRFWLCDILPLILDKEEAVQSSALSTMEQGFSILEMSLVHQSKYWVDIKTSIVTTYAPMVHKLRDNGSLHWYKVWCLLMRILDREILKSASTINPFLAIVEYGFRSPENRVRAEAFLCWRNLIEIFHKHGELNTPKRMKLICIPFKSSQSKTEGAAAIKLRVWWYLLVSLGKQLEGHVENLVEPFLIFCFGHTARCSVSTASQYESVRELALLCLSELWQTEPSEHLERLMKENSLPLLEKPSPLMDKKAWKQCWRCMLDMSFEAISLLEQHEGEGHSRLALIMPSLTNQVFSMDAEEALLYFFTKLSQLRASSIASALKTIVMEGMKLKVGASDDFELYKPTLNAFVKVLIVGKPKTPPEILRTAIKQIFIVKNFKNQKSLRRAWQTAGDVVYQAQEDEDYTAFETKLEIWLHLSECLLENMPDKSFTDPGHAAVLKRWVLWPLVSCMVFAGRRDSTTFDNAFCRTWGLLAKHLHSLNDKAAFAVELHKAIGDLLKARREEASLSTFLDTYLSLLVTLEISRATKKEFGEMWQSLKTAAELPIGAAALESCLNVLRQHFKALLHKDNVSLVLEDVKQTLLAIVRAHAQGTLDKGFFEEWKRSILESLRGLTQKSVAQQLKEALNSNEVFVIIPSVWSLNPDRLTERQKERFAEKAVLPALYNDMSQSNDSCATTIKPWTPNKVVIAKGDQSGISLEISGPSGGVQASDKCNDESEIIQPTGDSEEEAKNTRRTQLRSASLSKKAKTDGTKASTTTAAAAKSAPNQADRRCLRGKRDNNKDNVTMEEALNVSSWEMTGKQQQQCGDEANVSSSKDQQPQQQQQHHEKEDDAKMETEMAAMTTEATNADCVLTRELSPKRAIATKIPSLSSPPDRKLTNNSASPTLRPKPSTHLTGRGAQFINMIRNRKMDGLAHCSGSGSGAGAGPAPSHGGPTTSTPKSQIGKTATAPEASLDIGPNMDQTSTPVQQAARDLLVFSKRLPSPTASPSCSILKRKLRRDSLDVDVSVDSPAFKRKRVSFHDPPVSVTKEFLRDNDETMKTKRCLVLDKAGLEAKHALKRRSKLDSMMEIEKYASATTTGMDLSANQSGGQQSNKQSINNEAMNLSHDASAAAQGISLEDHNAHMLSNDNALKFVMENYSLEVVLDQFFDREENSPAKTASILAKYLSNYMNKSAKIKTNVLETLSENHSKDFLDHAVQENLSSVVCDRLNLNSVIDYVCDKSKINSNCRSNLLAKIPEIIKHSRAEASERLQFIEATIQNSSFSDENYLDLVSALMRMRNESKKSNFMQESAESAVDSSSNL